MTNQEQQAYERLVELIKELPSPIPPTMTVFDGDKIYYHSYQKIQNALAAVRKAQIGWLEGLTPESVPERCADMGDEKKREDAAVNFEEELTEEVEQRMAKDGCFRELIERLSNIDKRESLSIHVDRKDYIEVSLRAQTEFLNLRYECLTELVRRLDELDPVAAKRAEKAEAAVQLTREV